MAKKIELVRVFHRNMWRIGIRYGYNPDLNSMVRKISGAAYSGTNRFWHIPDRPDAAETVAACVGPGFTIVWADSVPGTGTPDSLTIPGPVVPLPAKHSSPVSATSPDDDILPRPQQMAANPQRRGCRVEIGNVPGSGKMMVKFHGLWEKEWIQEMKQYGYVEYLKERKEWRLPWSRMAIDSLSDYFSACGLQVEVRRNRQPEGVRSRREEVAGEIRARQLCEQSEEALRLLESHIREKRQSDSTVKTYVAMLQLFLKYYSHMQPLEIKVADISAFMTDFLIPLGYSASFQNQLITAIKTYYMLVNSRIDLGKLLRPKRSRSLPKVFSKEEIKRILNATPNLKHRLILWMIYSCGLRRSEVLNIKLTDLDRSRSILHIRQAKGKVDRIVPVSGKVWDKVDEYIEAFSPDEYLFEGQQGGRYTATSVYNVFRRAMRKAGINKEVGVHALRHSYATHLHEGGLDIRFIQELLGHRSSRTTEVYTHVSRRNLMAVKSPIDDLDLK